MGVDFQQNYSEIRTNQSYAIRKLPVLTAESKNVTPSCFFIAQRNNFSEPMNLLGN